MGAAPRRLCEPAAGLLIAVQGSEWTGRTSPFVADVRRLSLQHGWPRCVPPAWRRMRIVWRTCTYRLIESSGAAIQLRSTSAGQRKEPVISHAFDVAIVTHGQHAADACERQQRLPV
ncbi:hypothetical protein XFF7767_1030083 [Xanthomonas citri pv. fuscans]|nr:hypothetical protein XFF7767_1030083 [Xanthomonas citri pv. fuscans]SOO12893.1 hypothetical protein XFF7766_1140084 [Xanthomonas citri pv. fuscans]